MHRSLTRDEIYVDEEVWAVIVIGSKVSIDHIEYYQISSVWPSSLFFTQIRRKKINGPSFMAQHNSHYCGCMSQIQCVQYW